MFTPLMITNLNELIKEYEKMKTQKTKVTYSHKSNSFEIHLMLNGVWYLMATISKDLIKNKTMLVTDFIELIKTWAGNDRPDIDIFASTALIEFCGFNVVPNDKLNGVENAR